MTGQQLQSVLIDYGYVTTANEITPLNKRILSFNVELQANLTPNERIFHFMLTFKQS